MKRSFLGLALVVSASLLVAQQRPVGDESTRSIQQLFADYWEWRLADEPELATQMGRSEYNDRWRNWSKEARDRARSRREQFLKQALSIRSGDVPVVHRLSLDLLEFDLRNALESETWADVTSRTSQVDGAHNQVFVVIDQMPARTVKDYENIISRLRALPTYIDQTIDLLRQQLQRGLAQPTIVIDLVIDQLVAQSRPLASDSPLLLAFRRFPPSISGPDQKRLTLDAVAAFEQQFVPSWKRLERFLRETYRPKARSSIALTTLPGGRDGYARLVRSNTTTQMSAEEIHEIGLREVERITKEMEQIVRTDGFNGAVAEYQKGVAARPGMKFGSQQEMINYATDVLLRAQAGLPRVFRTLPRMAIGVRPIPSDREASTASNYTPGTADGSRQAWFNLNTYRPQEQVKYTIEAVTLHEGVPGHHVHLALAVETPGLPEFRRGFRAIAFGEGWGLYAEALGHDLGVYRDNATRFGQLSLEMFRAIRLVVDTGMHAKGWTRARAREYFARHVPDQSLAEIDRYIARPGQALAYKIGELKIRDLRRRAEQELGPQFDIRDFHDAVLQNGTLPLAMLDEQVNVYITAAKRR